MITGCDSEDLRERIDRAAVNSRLVERGNGGGTAAPVTLGVTAREAAAYG